MTQITTGDPIKAVTALIGKVALLPGSWEIISHPNIKTAPMRHVQGTKIR